MPLGRGIFRRRGLALALGCVALVALAAPGGAQEPTAPTVAPDLVSVGNLRTNVSGQVLADFTFDEPLRAAPAPAAGNFRLVLTDGAQFAGATVLAPTGQDPFAGGTVVTVRFSATQPDLPFSQIARGVVSGGTACDQDGSCMPLQAVAIGHGGRTGGPDLVRAVVVASDQVDYVFDEPVSAATGHIAASFSLYRADTTTLAATAAQRAQDDAAVVRVTFAGDAGAAVGAVAPEGAVRSGGTEVLARDDEAALVKPTLSIADAAGDEGSTFAFAVSVANHGGRPISVDYATAADTAGPADYNAANGTLAFASGENSKTVEIQTLADAEAEFEERFFVDLTNPAGATVATARAQGRIAGTAPEPPGDAPADTPDDGQPPVDPPVDPPPDTPPPVVRKLTASNTRFRAAGAARRKRRPPVGTTFAFRLSEAAAVTFAFERAVAGRRVRRRCVKPSPRLRRARRCNRWVAAGELVSPGLAGANRVRFAGRVGAKRLRPGRYRVTLTAVDPTGNRSTPRTIRFRIVR